jgi:DNA repair ATPase RecN
MSVKYSGNRWYKCDFHLHTPSSECFLDKAITPNQYIEKVIEEGLECIAITDHNNASWIDNLRGLAKENGIVCFPGAEITCGDAKVHMLILFDIDYSVVKIEDFLRDIGIRREDFGKQHAHTNKSVVDVATIAKECGAIAIPAHIDEYNGLSYASPDTRKDLIIMDNINSVQMVNAELITCDISSVNKDEILSGLQMRYSEISEPEVKDYIACTKLIKENKKGILTFSDNPESEESSKHGLWGIGRKYTWIKMDENPSLESLRQALLLPELRVRNCIEFPQNPYRLPDLWIKKVKVTDLEILGENVLEVDFNPQLNAIIGGRGSGKSSIIRLLTGIFSNKSLSELGEVYTEFTSFFQIKNKEKGVLKPSTKIEVELIKNELLYRITVFNFRSNNTYDTLIERFNNDAATYEKVEGIDIIDLFKIDIYNQKQIYELAKKPNILREKIDSLIDEMSEKKQKEDEIITAFKKQYSNVRELELKIKSKKKIQVELRDINEKINIYNKSGIKDVLSDYQLINNEQAILKQNFKPIQDKTDELAALVKSFNLPQIKTDSISAEYREELTKLFTERHKEFNTIKSDLENILNRLSELKQNANRDLTLTAWHKKANEVKAAYQSSLQELQNQGFNMQEVDILFEKSQSKQNELDEITNKEITLVSENQKLEALRREHQDVRDNIYKMRQDFLRTLLDGTNIKIDVKKYRDKSNFETRLRGILQKNTSFDEDFDKIASLCFEGNVLDNIDIFSRQVIGIKEGTADYEQYGVRFKNNVLKLLNDEQIAELRLLIPEDELQVKYRPSNSTQYKSLTNASAGQRTSAILTFILSDGNVPLLLDQPEDDLDNHLIYDLIVERLKSSKENRQIITVTHNANIPINGDAELIVAMDSTSKNVAVYRTGSIENKDIKDEICTVMEGGERAFIMRSKRYGIGR